MGHSRPRFLYFRLFNTVDSKQMIDKSLPMNRFEPSNSGVEASTLPTEPQPLPKWPVDPSEPTFLLRPGFKSHPHHLSFFPFID